MKTLDELKSLAQSKGIRITAKGYMLDGRYYRVEDWRPVLVRLDGYSPLTNQIAHWLKSAR